jgi:hypothetical protein
LPLITDVEILLVLGCADVVFNYNATKLAQLSRHPIVANTPTDDLYTYVSKSESSIRGAIDYLVPFALGEKKWPYPSEAADW